MRKIYLNQNPKYVYDENSLYEWVYTPKEAKERGISYLENWRDAQVGDWFLTTCSDDPVDPDEPDYTGPYVLRCLYHGGHYIRTCVGTFVFAYDVCDTKPRESRFTYSGKAQWSPRVSKKNCSEKEFTFAFSAVLFGSLEEAFKKAWPGVKSGIRWKAVNIYHRPHVQRAIAKIMGKGEITSTWLMAEAKKAYEENDLKKLKALKLLAEIHNKVLPKGYVRPPELSSEEKEELEEKKQAELRGDNHEPVGGNDRADDTV
jgi:hypothetical protein